MGNFLNENESLNFKRVWFLTLTKSLRKYLLEIINFDIKVG